MAKHEYHLSLSLLRTITRLCTATLGAMLVVLGATVGITLYHLGNTILPGVSVQGIDVSGLTVEEAVTVLTPALPALETLGVDIQVDERTWPMSWADVRQHYDVQATVQAAYRVGRDADGAVSLLGRLRNQNMDIAAVIAPADPAWVTDYIARIAAAMEIAPVDAHFAIEGGAVVAVDGQSGRRLDIETGVALALRALAEGSPSIELPWVAVPPQIIEPEPARTQAQAWLSQPFTLAVGDPFTNTDNIVQAEFAVAPERVITWFEPQVAGAAITLCVVSEPIEIWLVEIAEQLGAAHPLDIDATLHNVLAALYAGQFYAEAHIGSPTSVYVVQPGDTLLGVAIEFNTTVRALKEVNGLDSDLIVIGQSLLIPTDGLPLDARVEAVVEETPGLVLDTPADSIPSDVDTLHSTEWREDLAILVTEVNKLPEIHAGGFGAVHDTSFTQAIAKLDAAIPVLEDHKIVVGIMQILTLLGDAHTRVNLYAWQAFQERAYPIELQWFSDGLFVTAAQPGYEELLKLEVVQVGGASIKQLLTMLERTIPHESMYRVLGASTDYMIRPVILHALGLTSELQRAAFTFQDANGYTITRYLTADAPTSMQDKWISALSGNSSPLYLQKSQDTYYWYTYLESARTLYFQFNRCAEQPDAPLEEFLAELSHVIATHPVERYVIDLRRNPGGSPGPSGLILDHIQRHPQFAQQNKLFVLTGNKTFSSAVYLASLLRYHAHAILVGEPTAQGPNFYASPKAFVLPNSGLTINLSYAYVQSAETSAETMQPDLWVALSSADYFAGHDPVLSAALSR